MRLSERVGAAPYDVPIPDATDNVVEPADTPVQYVAPCITDCKDVADVSKVKDVADVSDMEDVAEVREVEEVDVGEFFSDAPYDVGDAFNYPAVYYDENDKGESSEAFVKCFIHLKRTMTY